MTYMDRITIGIPAFNESRYIDNALKSAVGQSRHIIVSDNGSDDDTAKTCALIATTDSDIQMIRHTENRGAAFNFRFLLDQCQTEYFMWLGAHDLIPPDYTRTLIATLDDHPDAIMAYSDANHIDPDGNPVRTETYTLLKHHLESLRREVRMLAIVKHLSDCSMIHGVWRTEGLRRAWVEGDVPGRGSCSSAQCRRDRSIALYTSHISAQTQPQTERQPHKSAATPCGRQEQKVPHIFRNVSHTIADNVCNTGHQLLPSSSHQHFGQTGRFNARSYLKLLGLTGK